MYSFVTQLGKRLDTWIFAGFSVNADQLSAFRIFFAGYYLLWVGVPSFSNRLAAFPEGIFLPPPGPMRLFSGIPDPWIIQGIDALLPLLWVMLAIGLFTRWVSVLLSVLMILLFGWVYSSGKIDHNFIAWLTPLVMAFSNWGKKWSVDAAWGRSSGTTQAWPVSLMAMILGYGWFTAGTIKIAGGWLDTETAMSQAFFLRNYYGTERAGLLSDWFIQLQSPLIWEGLDWLTIVFETGFLIAAFFPALFRLFTLTAICFHLMVLLQLNIVFAHYQPLYLLFWTPYLSATWLRSFFAERQATKRSIAAGLLLLCLSTEYLANRSPVDLLILMLGDRSLKPFFTLLLPLLIIGTGFWIWLRKGRYQAEKDA